MYRVRIEIDENQEKTSEPYRLPKDFISYLTHSVSSKQTQLKIIERLLFRLGRISYETYNISHFDRELFEISDDLQSIYLDENRSHFQRDEEINRAKMDDLLHFGMLLENTVRLSPLSFSDLYSQKRILKYSIREYQKKGIRVKLHDRLKAYIGLSDFCVLLSNVLKMKFAVNAFCTTLYHLELDTFSINCQSLIEPIFLIKEIRRNEWGHVYSTLSKRKFLYIDADEMKDTIKDLSIEYKKICESKIDENQETSITLKDSVEAGKINTESKEVSTGISEIYSHGTVRDLDNLENVEKAGIQRIDIIGFNKSIKDVDGKEALFDILQKTGVGIWDGGFLFILMNKEEDKEPIYRTVCFVAQIIYDYQSSCKMKTIQKYLLSGIYLIQKKIYEDFKTKKINLEEILSNSDHEKNTENMRRKVIDRAIGILSSATGYELEQRKRILNIIEKDYHEFLCNMHMYSEQVRFYKNVVKNIQENLPVVIDTKKKNTAN